MPIHLIFLRMVFQRGVPLVGTFRWRTVHTQRKMVQSELQMISVVPRKLGADVQPSLSLDAVFVVPNTRWVEQRRRIKNIFHNRLKDRSREA